MRKFILILSFILSFEAFAGEVPEKFQNPIFNDVLYSGGNKTFSHDILITPTSITDYDNSQTNGICEYITEDENGFLLKCEYPDFIKGYVVYEMVYARYQTDFRMTGGSLYCDVWMCSFEVENGQIQALGVNAPENHHSKIYHCAGEKDSFHDFPTGGPKMNCLDELKLRGWEKYIPGKWIKKVNTWQ